MKFRSIHRNETYETIRDRAGAADSLARRALPKFRNAPRVPLFDRFESVRKPLLFDRFDACRSSFGVGSID